MFPHLRQRSRLRSVPLRRQWQREHQESGQSLSQQGFAAAGRTHKQNVAFGQFDIIDKIFGVQVVLRVAIDAFVVIINRNG